MKVFWHILFIINETIFKHDFKNKGKPVGDTVLFYGCRKKSEDFLYEEEFQESIDEGLLTVNIILIFLFGF